MTLYFSVNHAMSTIKCWYWDPACSLCNGKFFLQFLLHRQEKWPSRYATTLNSLSFGFMACRKVAVCRHCTGCIGLKMSTQTVTTTTSTNSRSNMQQIKARLCSDWQKNCWLHSLKWQWHATGNFCLEVSRRSIITLEECRWIVPAMLEHCAVLCT